MGQFIIDHLHVVLLAIQSVLHHESTAHIVRVDILQILHNFVCFIALIEALELNDFIKAFSHPTKAREVDFTRLLHNDI